MIFETGLSTLNISRAKRAPNTINFVDMRLVLQSLFNLFNVQNLIGLYALCNIRQRQMLALSALNRRRPMQRRRNRRFRFWCLPRPRQSWFEIHYNDHRIPDGFFKQQLRVRRATFNQLLNNVSPHVARQDTSMRNCIPAEKILAIGLYRLEHGNSYVSIAPFLTSESPRSLKQYKMS